MTALLQVAVAQQLERPALARALDFIQPTLALTPETEAMANGMAGLMAELLATHGVRAPARTAQDIVAMTIGMIDAAGMAGETDQPALVARVSCAVFGYLRGLAVDL